MDPNASFKKELKVFIIKSLIVIVLIACQFFVWKFVASSAHQLHEKRTQEEQLDNLLSRINEIEENYEAQKALIDQLEVIFPQQTSASQAVERLERMADQVRVNMDIRSITEEKQQNMVALTVVVSVTGPATSLLRYIDSIEHVPELTSIKGWSLNSGQRSNRDTEISTEYNLLMNVVFYMQPQN